MVKIEFSIFKTPAVHIFFHLSVPEVKFKNLVDLQEILAEIGHFEIFSVMWLIWNGQIWIQHPKKPF